MNPPLVSICIPTYNRPEFLRRTIQSVLSQTFQDFEIVITDNSTNNESAKLVETLNDPRIHYYKNPIFPGPGHPAIPSSNRALSLARAKYKQLLMDDDLIKPKFLELMVAALEKNPTAGLVMAPMSLVDGNDRRIFPKFYLFRTMQYRYRYQVGDGLIQRKRLLRDFLTRDYPCCVPCGILYRAEALGPDPFEAEIDFANDLLLCMKIATQWDFYYIDEVLSSWRFIPVGHTAKLHDQGFNIRIFYAVSRQILSRESVKEMFRAEWSQIQRDSLFFCSCRALLINGLAGWRSRSPKLIWQTIQTVRQEDPYLLNRLRLPFWAFRQIWVSLFPPKLPPARE